MDALMRFAGVGIETAADGRLRESTSNALPRLVDGGVAARPSSGRAQQTPNHLCHAGKRNTAASHKRARPLSAEFEKSQHATVLKFKPDNFNHTGNSNASSSSSSSSSDSSYESDFELEDNTRREGKTEGSDRLLPRTRATSSGPQQVQPRCLRSLRHSRFGANRRMPAPTLTLSCLGDESDDENKGDNTTTTSTPNNLPTPSSSQHSTGSPPALPQLQHWRHEKLKRPSTDGNFSSSGSLVYSDFVVRPSGIVPNPRPVTSRDDEARRPRTCGLASSPQFRHPHATRFTPHNNGQPERLSPVTSECDEHDMDDLSAWRTSGQTGEQPALPTRSNNLCCQDDLLPLGYLGRGASGVVTKALHATALVIVAVKAVPAHDAKKRDQSVAEIRSLYKTILPFPHQVARNSPSNKTHFGCADDTVMECRTGEREGKYCEPRDEESKSGLPSFQQSETASHCPYIVSLYDAFINRREATINLALEWMDGGSLQDVIDARNIPLPESAIANVAACVLHGLVAVHARRQIHRDLKPSNILLNSDGVAKLSDFGVAHTFGTQSNANTFVGSVSYMAPERIAPASGGASMHTEVASDKPEGYSYASDIWSAGLCIMVCATGGKYPYATAYSEGGYWGLVQAISKEPAPRLIPLAFNSKPHRQGHATRRAVDQVGPHSPELCDFVSQCLRTDPASRPTAQELLMHPFLRKHHVTRRRALDGGCVDPRGDATTRAAVAAAQRHSLLNKLPKRVVEQKETRMEVDDRSLDGEEERAGVFAQQRKQLARVLECLVQHHRSASLKLQHTLPRFSTLKLRRLAQQLRVDLSEKQAENMCHRLQVDCCTLKPPKPHKSHWARRTTELEFSHQAM